MPVGVTPCLILIFPFVRILLIILQQTKTCHNLLNIISQDLPWMSLLHLICLFLTVLFVYNVHKLLKHTRHNAEQHTRGCVVNNQSTTQATQIKLAILLNMNTYQSSTEQS